MIGHTMHSPPELASQVGLYVHEYTHLGRSHDCDLYRLELDGGRRGFLKASTSPRPALFYAEARGLEWLAEAAAVPVPAMWGFGECFLILQWIETTSPTKEVAEDFGRNLARLHASGAPYFGAPWQGWLAELPMDNTISRNWPRWFAEQRLLPYIRIAHDKQFLGGADITRLEAVVNKIESIVGNAPPSRIHGDCWYGNILWTDRRAYLIDPAAHGGHRETDIGLLHLFGAPHLDAILETYHSEYPLEPDWRERMPLHQLHALLLHVALFGERYRARTMEAVSRLT